MAWHSHANARTVVTISMLIHILQFEICFKTANPNPMIYTVGLLFLYIIVYDYGVCWIASEIHGVWMHVFFGVLG